MNSITFYFSISRIREDPEYSKMCPPTKIREDPEYSKMCPPTKIYVSLSKRLQSSCHLYLWMRDMLNNKIYRLNKFYSHHSAIMSNNLECSACTCNTVPDRFDVANGTITPMILKILILQHVFLIAKGENY